MLLLPPPEGRSQQQQLTGDGEGSKPPLAALSLFWDVPETLTDSTRCELADVLTVVLLQFVRYPKQQLHGEAGTASLQDCKGSLL